MGIQTGKRPNKQEDIPDTPFVLLAAGITMIGEPGAGITDQPIHQIIKGAEPVVSSLLLPVPPEGIVLTEDSLYLVPDGKAFAVIESTIAPPLKAGAFPVAGFRSRVSSSSCLVRAACMIASS
ncbi:hypothetical protein ASZ90_010614 [hydrocarbon metagenome]|uniref:Uncharacterized protein n=1 Tax=hydrocarbon metagenome TaxID=938273 RepID=A0A0W8FFP6_9ZZZZ